MTTVGNEEIPTLIDTGAMVSAISQALFDSLKPECQGQILPVSTVKIKGVIPDRVIKCKLQILLRFNIQVQTFEHIFLVLKNLSFDMILGVDFIQEHGMIIDLRTTCIPNRRHETD